MLVLLIANTALNKICVQDVMLIEIAAKFVRKSCTMKTYMMHEFTSCLVLCSTILSWQVKKGTTAMQFTDTCVMNFINTKTTHFNAGSHLTAKICERRKLKMSTFISTKQGNKSFNLMD